jgi:Nose resistant-to-fluoxetine protein, N-terminal domain
VLFSVFDASAYYAGGYFGGTLHRYVPPDQCRALNAKTYGLLTTNEEDFQDQFFDEDDIQPFEVTVTNAKYEVAMADSPASGYIIQSICMPRSCNLYDLSQVLAYNNISKSEKVVDVDLVELRAIPGEYSFAEDASFHVIM